LETNKPERKYTFKDEKEYLDIIDQFFPESELIYKLEQAEIELQHNCC
jgi:hypothetical protein